MDIKEEKKKKKTSNIEGEDVDLFSSHEMESKLFNKHFERELYVSKDELPIVLQDLSENAYQFIKRKEYDRGLTLTQKAYGLMD